MTDSSHVGKARGHTFPLNSKRLTVSHLRMIAQAMKLPTGVSTDEVRQLVEGELTGVGKEPQNVQVAIKEDGSIVLQDKDGPFLTVEEAEELREPTETGEDGLFEEEEPEDRPMEARDPEVLQRQLNELNHRYSKLESELDTMRKQLEAQIERGTKLAADLEHEKERRKQMWRLSCQQLSEHDELVAEKDAEIQKLSEELSRVRRSPDRRETSSSDVRSVFHTCRVRESASEEASDEDETGLEQAAKKRRGRAPPLESFTGESEDTTLDDWLPGLRRVADWNHWSEKEILIQLAGYLRGRALQEWNLLSKNERKSYKTAVKSLKDRLGYGSHIMAAQDFRHTAQREGEAVSDFIRRLERSFTIAYGRDNMSEDTRSTLLYGQLQEGLRYEVMKSPGVSGAQSYRDLCIAARNEEKRQVELRKKQKYGARAPTSNGVVSSGVMPSGHNRTSRARGSQGERLCFVCRSPDHLERSCPKKKSPRESEVKPSPRPMPSTRCVRGTSQAGLDTPNQTDNPFDLLYSDSDDSGGVRVVRVNDTGSKSQYIKLIVAGVPTLGVIDTGSDITIMGELFKKVAAVARLRKRDFKSADKSPRGYDGTPFRLDGRIDLEITIGDRSMKTPVYVPKTSYYFRRVCVVSCRQSSITLMLFLCLLVSPHP